MADTEPQTPVQEFENLVRSADPTRLQEAFCPDFTLNYEVVADLSECDPPDREVIFLDPLSEEPNTVVRCLNKQKEHDTDVRERVGGCYNKPTLVQWLATEKLKYKGDIVEVTDPATRVKVCRRHTREEALRELARDDAAFRERLQEADQKASEYEERVLRLQLLQLQFVEEALESLEELRETMTMDIEEQNQHLHNTRELLTNGQQRYEQLRNLGASPEILNSARDHINRLRRIETRALTYIDDCYAVINLINGEIARRNELGQDDLEGGIEMAQRVQQPFEEDDMSEITTEPSDIEDNDPEHQEQERETDAMLMEDYQRLLQSIADHRREAMGREDLDERLQRIEAGVRTNLDETRARYNRNEETILRRRLRDDGISDGDEQPPQARRRLT